MRRSHRATTANVGVRSGQRWQLAALLFASGCSSEPFIAEGGADARDDGATDASGDAIPDALGEPRMQRRPGRPRWLGRHPRPRGRDLGRVLYKGAKPASDAMTLGSVMLGAFGVKATGGASNDGPQRLSQAELLVP